LHTLLLLAFLHTGGARASAKKSAK